MPPTSTRTHTLLSSLLKPSGQKEAAFKEFGSVESAYKIPTQMLLGNQAPDFSGLTWQHLFLSGCCWPQVCNVHLVLPFGTSGQSPSNCTGALPRGDQLFPRRPEPGSLPRCSLLEAL